MLAEGAQLIKEDSLLIIDPTDITKKYAKKMEWLARVRDAGEKEKSLGYWVDTVVGAETDSSEIVPLVHRLYSQDSSDFVSENHELINAITQVRQACDGRGIFVIDRGGDRGSLFKKLLEEAGVRFIIRQRGDRRVLYKDKLKETLRLAGHCKTPYTETVIKEKDGKEKAYSIAFGLL